MSTLGDVKAAATQFTYDAIGNRLDLTRTPEQTVYHYALDSQRLLQETGPVTRSFAFNPVGSVVQAGGDRYVYDPEQRLLQVLRGTTTVADYRYDAFGQRSRKTAAGVTTHYQYDPEDACWPKPICRARCCASMSTSTMASPSPPTTVANWPSSPPTPSACRHWPSTAAARPSATATKPSAKAPPTPPA